MEKINFNELSLKKKLISISKILVWIAFIVSLIYKSYELALLCGIMVVWDIYNILSDRYARRKK